MRKTALTLLALCAGLAACTDPDSKPMTPEQDYLMNAYADVTSAYAWDTVCNKGRKIAAKDPVLSGNLSMIATQVYQVLRNTNAGAPDDVLTDAAVMSGKSMQEMQEKLLKEQGCDAAGLQAYKAAHARYTSVPAEQNYIRIMQDMHKKGIQRAAPRPDAAPAGAPTAPLPEAGRQKAIDLLTGHKPPAQK